MKGYCISTNKRVFECDKRQERNTKLRSFIPFLRTLNFLIRYWKILLFYKNLRNVMIDKCKLKILQLFKIYKVVIKYANWYSATQRIYSTDFRNTSKSVLIPGKPSSYVWYHIFQKCLFLMLDPCKEHFILCIGWGR